MDTIKCGRVTYNLAEGDTVMDNGKCLQLITREVGSGWNRFHPKVSKAAFAQFKANTNVSIETDHAYGDWVTLYRYG